MTRGLRPFVAIAEAQRRAASWGFVVSGLVMNPGSRFDFTFHDQGRISLVRVRRLKYPFYGTESIERNCAHQIKEFREQVVPEGVCRELWVRGPERSWHRYRILPETIEEVKDIPAWEGSITPPEAPIPKPESLITTPGSSISTPGSSMIPSKLPISAPESYMTPSELSITSLESSIPKPERTE
jgi:hypothetical protein